MARLEGRELVLDVMPRGQRYGWMEYEILFLWRDQPVLNESILRRGTEFHNTERQGAFMANLCPRTNGGYEEGLVEVIEEVLKTNKPGIWEPQEPDVSITLHPTKYTARCFTLTVFVDANAFEGCGCYTGEGVSLTIVVTRESLADFCEQLKKEHDELVCV